MISNCILYLIGFAGTGKFTIAKEIVLKENFKLVDNHLINSPIFQVIESDGKSPLPEAVWDKTSIIRDAVLDTIVNISGKHLSFVFTNELIDGEKHDVDIYNKVKQVATQRGSRFLPVRLTCSEDELCKRVSSQERRLRYKEIDTDSARKKSREKIVFSPDDKNTVTIDTTLMDPSKVAEVIMSHLNSLD